MVEPNWEVLSGQLKEIFSDLGIEDSAGFKRTIIEQLWRRQCPECVPMSIDGQTNYHVIRAAVKDIDSGKERACECVLYAVTQDTYEAFCELYKQLPVVAGRAPCGYAWTKRAPDGSLVFVPGSAKGQEQVPDIDDQIVDVEDAPAAAPSKFSLGKFLLFVGATVGAAYAFTSMNDGFVRANPARSKDAKRCVFCGSKDAEYSDEFVLEKRPNVEYTDASLNMCRTCMRDPFPIDDETGERSEWRRVGYGPHRDIRVVGYASTWHQFHPTWPTVRE